MDNADCLLCGHPDVGVYVQVTTFGLAMVKMSDVRLRVDVTASGDVPVVNAHGEIDLYTAEELRREMQSVTATKPRAMIVDLSGVSYIDSSGLSELLSAYRDLQASGAQLYVIASHKKPGVSRVLEITRLDHVFRVCGNLEEAIDEIGLPRAA